MNHISDSEVDKLYNKLDKEAESSGYHLNPDEKFTKDLVRGLIVNQKRYGYQSCPCRLASGKKEEDLDIICPCDYRDPDLNKYGACYCGLYVSKNIREGKKALGSIPERRKSKKERDKMKKDEKNTNNVNNLKKPIWRCKVCGYLCARDDPPDICPICKVNKERFEKFIK